MGSCRLTLDQLTRDSRALIMAQLLSVLLALSLSLLVDGRDVLGLGEVKHVMAGEEYNLRQQLSQVSILNLHVYIRGMYKECKTFSTIYPKMYYGLIHR